MSDTLISSTGYVQIESTDGTITDTIRFGGSNIERVSDSKEVLFTGDAEPPLGYTAENEANKTTTVTNSTTKYPSGAAVTTALNLKLDASKQSINTTVAGLKSIGVPQSDVLYQTNDYGGGNWFWNAADNTTENTGTVIQATGIATGRFNRILEGKKVYVNWFGATGDGSTDDYDAIQNAINFINGDGVVVLPAGTYYLNKSLAGGLKLPANAKGLVIEGYGRGNTTIKLSRDVPRAFDSPLAPDKDHTVLCANITLQDFDIDANCIDGTVIAETVIVVSDVEGSDTYVDVNIGDNSGFLNGGACFFLTGNSGNTKGKVAAVRLKSGSSTTIQVLIAPGATIKAGDKIKGACRDHVLFGNNFYGGTQAPNYNVNYDNITIRNINGHRIPPAEETPTDHFNNASTQRDFVVLKSPNANSYGGSGYAGMLYATNITIENCYVSGGYAGFSIVSNELSTPYFIGRIRFKNLYHDTLTVPSNQYNSKGFVVGYRGFGDDVVIEDCISKNSGDVGFETGSLLKAYIIGCQAYSSFGSNFFSTNYNYPALTSDGTITSTLSAYITGTATTMTLSSVPTNAPENGWCTIEHIEVDDTGTHITEEAVYYTKNYESDTLTIIRGLNGTAGITHDSGSIVRFLDLANQSVNYINCYGDNSGITASGGAQGFYQQRGNGSVLPPPPINIKNCYYTRTGTDIGFKGEALKIMGQNQFINVDGFNINIGGFVYSSADTFYAARAIELINTDYAGNVTDIPAQSVVMRNLDININGALNNQSTYTAILFNDGNRILDLQIINIVQNLANTTSNQSFGINWGSNTNYTSGKIDSLIYSNSGDGQPAPIYINSANNNIGKLFISNSDFSKMEYDILSGNNSNYKPYQLNANAADNIFISKTRTPVNAVTNNYPLATLAKHRVEITTDYTASFDDGIIAVKNMSSPITITLPLVDSGNPGVNYGAEIKIIDESYLAGTYHIVVQPATSTEHINQASSYTISSNGGQAIFTAAIGGYAATIIPLPPTALANPATSIGLTVNNGTALTAMRSDAAPALNQAIAPTWTGVHRFTPTVTGADYARILTSVNTATADNQNMVAERIVATFDDAGHNGITHAVVGYKWGGQSYFYIANARGDGHSEIHVSATPTASNYVLDSEGTNTDVNIPSSGGNLSFRYLNNPLSRLFGTTGNLAIGTTTDNATDKLQVNGSIISGIAGTAQGALKIAGATSGTVSILAQAAAGTYNLNLPTTPGTAGQVLTSQGGGSSAMTWTIPAVDAVNTATDANYTVTSAFQFVKLPVITANRTVTIPSAASYAGQSIKIWNQNTAGFTWSFAGATVKDAGNNTITSLTNATVYILESDGTNWIKMN